MAVLLEDNRKDDAGIINVEKAVAYYYDNINKINEFIRTDLKTTFSQKTVNKRFSGRLEYANYITRIVDKLTNLWTDAPQYVVNGKDDEKIKENFSKLSYYDNIRTIAALMRLLNTVIVHIAYRDNEKYVTGEQNEFVEFIILHKGNCKLTFDDNNQIESYEYTVGEITKKWTKDTIITTQGGKTTEIDNPYGFLPMVEFKYKEKNEDYWGQPLNQLVNSNETVNKFMNVMDYQAEYSGMGLVGIIGFGLKKKGEVKQSISFNPDEPFVSEDTQAKIDVSELKIYQQEFNELIQKKASFAMENLGLPADSIVIDYKGSSQSGIAKLIESAELYDLLDEFKLKIKNREALLLEKLNRILEVQKAKELYYEPNLKASNIDIQYNATEPYTSEKDKLDMVHKRIENGTLSPTEAIMSLDNIDETEANKKFITILKEITLLNNAGAVNGQAE